MLETHVHVRPETGVFVKAVILPLPLFFKKLNLLHKHLLEFKISIQIKIKNMYNFTKDGG